MPIVFCLGVRNAKSIEEIIEVYSQNHALNQCNQFFNQYHEIIKKEEIDTAIAAERVARGGRKIGAICSKLACKLNNLNILLEDFQDEKNNYTEFALISK